MKVLKAFLIYAAIIGFFVGSMYGCGRCSIALDFVHKETSPMNAAIEVGGTVFLALFVICTVVVLPVAAIYEWMSEK